MALTLIGKRGRFVLIAPFNIYTNAGLLGEIVAVNRIQHLVSTGTDTKSLIYSPVNAEDRHATDLRANVIIVTIKTGDGTKYHIPDIFIKNLYNDDLEYLTVYITARLGVLPKSYDYAAVKEEIADVIAKVTGETVGEDDIFVSTDGESVIRTYEEASVEDAKRINKTKNLDNNYGKLLKANEKIEQLIEINKSLEILALG